MNGYGITLQTAMVNDVIPSGMSYCRMPVRQQTPGLFDLYIIYNLLLLMAQLSSCVPLIYSRIIYCQPFDILTIY